MRSIVSTPSDAPRAVSDRFALAEIKMTSDEIIAKKLIDSDSAGSMEKKKQEGYF
jgi:hypothetical protein